MPEQLVAVCQAEDVSPPSDALRAEQFIVAARYHRIAPLAHVAYRDVAPALAEELRRDRDTAMAVHMRANALLHQVDELLADLPWVTFKGAVLSELAHPRPGLRTYHDVDLLVSPADLRETSRRMLGAGWAVADYDDMLRNPQTPGEMHWVSPVGLLVDLHWSMTNTAVRRARLSVPSDDLLRRRRQVSLGLSSAWTLDPVDSLIHVCLHATLTGANRLLLLLDVDQLARGVQDWDAVVEQAKQWRAEPHLFLALHRAHAVLATPLPAQLARLLGLSRAFVRICSQVDRWAPVPEARREPGLARLVARAVRNGAAPTVVSVVRSLGIGAAERLTGSKDRRPSVRTDADDDALAHYLDAVESAEST